LREETIQDYAELARLGRVTRARMTQIMKLLDLAPDIQEQILSLPLIQGLNEKNLRPLASRIDWDGAAARDSHDHGSCVFTASSPGPLAAEDVPRRRRHRHRHRHRIQHRRLTRDVYREALLADVQDDATLGVGDRLRECRCGPGKKYYFVRHDW
jgi:hypothetical protein